MKANRLMYIVVVVALVCVLGFTARTAFATETASVTDTVPGQKGSSEVACADLPSRYSIRNEYVKEMGIWVTYTEDGSTGVNGGLIDLMSMYRICSR